MTPIAPYAARRQPINQRWSARKLLPMPQPEHPMREGIQQVTGHAGAEKYERAQGGVGDTGGPRRRRDRRQPMRL